MPAKSTRRRKARKWRAWAVVNIDGRLPSGPIDVRAERLSAQARAIYAARHCAASRRMGTQEVISVLITEIRPALARRGRK